MEPMTLGSPTGGTSPAIGSPYLPSFLMGDTNVQSTPRNNTLSPSKARTLGFASQSPHSTQVTSPEFNRCLQQKSLFVNSYQGQQQAANLNTSLTGPPTQGLFDSLRAEKNSIQSPNTINHSLQTSQYNQSINDSFLNLSHVTSTQYQSPHYSNNANQTINTSNNNNLSMYNYTQQQQQSNNKFINNFNKYNLWITVYGFQQQQTNVILSHFSQFGTIIDKILPKENCNWLHIKYSSKLECDKSINYNGKIISNNMMIGVNYCNDKSIIDKENYDECLLNRVRPLTHIAYKNEQNSTDVSPSPIAPKRSTGIVNKAMDLFFGW